MQEIGFHNCMLQESLRGIDFEIYIESGVLI